MKLKLRKTIFVTFFASILLLLVSACGEPPPGEEVGTFSQSACLAQSNKPLTTKVPQQRFGRDVVSLTVSGNDIKVTYKFAHFRCAQKVKMYSKLEGKNITITVRPIDMNPSMVAGCDCEYNLSGKVGPFSSGKYTVTVFRQWDRSQDSEAPAPKKIGSKELELK